MLHQVLTGSSLLTKALDDNTRTADNLYGLTFCVVSAQACPFTKDLRVLDLDHGDLVLIAQGGNQLDVHSLVARRGQHTQVSLAAIESLDALMETTSKAIEVKRGAENLRRCSKGRVSMILSKYGKSTLHIQIQPLYTCFRAEVGSKGTSSTGAGAACCCSASICWLSAVNQNRGLAQKGETKLTVRRQPFLS